ncbi:MAG: ATP-binding protein [Coriobacteriia bacterium]|nr:ATP-binding protein [Coriobacteriia bacterium]
MGRKTRVITFVVLVIALTAAFYIVAGQDFLLDVPTLVVYTSLVTMTLVVFLVEHYFGTPSGALATSISGVLLLIPAYEGLSDLGPVYWLILVWCVGLVACSSAALMILPDREAHGAKAERARSTSARLKGLSVQYGSARLVFGSIAVTTALVYMMDDPYLVGLVFLYVVVIFGLDTRRLGASRPLETTVVGTIVRIEPNNVLRVTVGKYSDLVAGSKVAYILPGDDASARRQGTVAKVYRTIGGPEAVVIEDVGVLAPAGPAFEHGDVAVLPEAATASGVGLVSDNSRISSIKVQTLSLSGLQEGSLLAANVAADGDQTEVIYQVFDAAVRHEDAQALTIAEAVQLGVWSTAECGLVRYGWVPPVNTLITPVDGSCSTSVPDESILLGHLPGTEYPVALNRDALRGTHIAILGVTGCGKSVTSRYLLKELATDHSRVVVVDLTGEYGRLLRDPAPNAIVTQEVQGKLIASIEKLMLQMAEFPNKRDQNLIRDCEANLDKGFRQSLGDWITADDGTYALLELPSFENTATSLEYTRWFLRTLFDIARTDGLAGKNVTVVLEEAHTVVPEWNFAGARGDRSAEGLLNSIAQIALQGRKYGIGFVVIAQRTANVSKTVLTQCSSVIAFRSYDNTSADFLSNYLGDELVKALPNLPDRHAIVVGSAFRSQVPLICQVLDIDEGNAEDGTVGTGLEAQESADPLPDTLVGAPSIGESSHPSVPSGLDDDIPF